MANTEIVIPYCPHDGQLAVHNSKARFRIAVWGRRSGKTTAAINEMIRVAITKENSRIFYIAPSYRQAKMIAYKMMVYYLPREVIDRVNQVELTFYLKNGSEISLKGADNEDTLRGVGLDFVVLDEFASMKSNVWTEIIRPSLADSGGGAIFIGTPKGKNHFYDIYLKGLDEKETEYESWNYSTLINKVISIKEIEQARKDMSERLFNQEFMAQWIDDETSVFKGVAKCSIAELKSAREGRLYYMGVDLARHNDFTVMWVFDAITRETVAWERLNDISWMEQKSRIIKLAKQYNNAIIIIDSTGAGEPIFEDLQISGCSIEGYKFTNKSKVELIENLQIAIEQRLILIPNDDIIKKEFMEFGYEYSEKTGQVIYNAPSGRNDDCVIACALGAWGIRNYIRSSQLVEVRPDEEREIVDRAGRGEPVVDMELELRHQSISGY